MTVKKLDCEPKVWWRSKTVWISILMFIIWGLSILEGLTDNKLYTAVLALITLALGLVLRWLTGSPITLTQLHQVVVDGMTIWVQKDAEVRANPASAKTEPWPAPVLPPEIRSQWNGENKPPPGGG
jgi:hypothetical protein